MVVVCHLSDLQWTDRLMFCHRYCYHFHEQSFARNRQKQFVSGTSRVISFHKRRTTISAESQLVMGIGPGLLPSFGEPYFFYRVSVHVQNYFSTTSGLSNSKVWHFCVKHSWQGVVAQFLNDFENPEPPQRCQTNTCFFFSPPNGLRNQILTPIFSCK